jgi:hemerythrin-like domain-containing protein
VVYKNGTSFSGWRLDGDRQLISIENRKCEMKPIGPLMREHRLIERMVALLNKELKQLTEKKETDVEFLMVAVDFIHTYADRTHHGKEEDILFRELAKKRLSPEHKKTMNELIEEHASARRMTRNLANARESYVKGSLGSVKDIVAFIRELVDFYPQHIEKEDKHFFYPCLEYLSKQEQDDMLQEFWEFDRKLIHEKYENVVGELEKEKSNVMK